MNNKSLLTPMFSPETYIKEFSISNPSSTLYYEPTVDVSLEGYIPVSAGFSTYSISTNCYQCRFITATQVKMGFCLGYGSQGNLEPGSVGKLTVVYLKKWVIK